LTTADWLRILLLATIVMLAFMALAYLRRRRLGWSVWLAWSLVAVLLPVLGPILVMSLRPAGPVPTRGRAPALRSTRQG
jgi:hypothetical protein